MRKRPTYKVELHKQQRKNAFDHPLETFYCATLDEAVELQKTLDRCLRRHSEFDRNELIVFLAATWVYVLPVDDADEKLFDAWGME